MMVNDWSLDDVLPLERTRCCPGELSDNETEKDCRPQSHLTSLRKVAAQRPLFGESLHYLPPG